MFVCRLLGIVCVVLGTNWHGNALANEYKVHINARADSADRIKVEIQLPSLLPDSNVVVFPVTVPGTYESHLWWRLVHDFRAFDATGFELSTSRTPDSQFVIPPIAASISYSLDDSFDDKDKRVSVFHPAGTSFQGDSVFVLNHGGIVCYVQGLQKLPYTIRVLHKAGIVTQTALPVTHREPTLDEYRAQSYDELVDGPAMVCKPDTTTFMVKDTKVLVAVCSNDDGKSQEFAKTLQSVTEAIGNFLPRMPVKSYAFLIYLWDMDFTNVIGGKYAQGALEHGTSSFYFLRASRSTESIADIAAHEFLHILVPLNLHSKEIDAFDFRWPQMSEHLWLYEGVTEYFAHQALYRGGVTNEGDFFQELDHGARSISYLPKDFSLTSFSRDVLLEKNQRLYPIIYSYGPLNALLLDILIRKETNGAKGLLETVYDLMHTFGPSKPFNDPELFEVIGKVTSPKVTEYLQDYVASAKLLPLKEMLPLIGWEFMDSVRNLTLTFGVRFLGPPGDDKRLHIGPGKVNPLGVEKGDILVEIDGHPADAEKSEMFRRLWEPGSTDPITLVVERAGKRVTLSGPPIETVEVSRNVIQELPNATEEQIAFRRLVLKGVAGMR